LQPAVSLIAPMQYLPSPSPYCLICRQRLCIPLHVAVQPDHSLQALKTQFTSFEQDIVLQNLLWRSLPVACLPHLFASREI
jgi:hypothetical protein